MREPTILAIETSSNTCSVSLSLPDGARSTRISAHTNDHSTTLTPHIQSLLTASGLIPHDLDAVAVSEGPGSYTGLRIGFSTAKGLCFGTGKPLILIPTLAGQALAIRESIPKKEASVSEYLLAPMIDARRMEVYTALYSSTIVQLEEPGSYVLTEKIPDIPSSTRVYYGGSGADKAHDLLFSAQWVMVECPIVNAEHILTLALESYRNEKFANLAYCEPFYLKRFVAAPSKPGILDHMRGTVKSARNTPSE